MGSRLRSLSLSVVLFSLGASAADGSEMAALLKRGPLVLVEQGSDGKFGQATVMVQVNAPPARVWAVAMDFAHYVDFMPKVLKSELKAGKSPLEADVRFVLDVPGPDTDYTFRVSRDDTKREAKASWLKGDLKGSRWQWSVQPQADGGTLLTHVLSLKEFSSVAQGLEDDAQTITIGVNVSSALAAVKAIKRKSEEAQAQPAPKPEGK